MQHLEGSGTPVLYIGRTVKSDFMDPFWLTMEFPCAHRQFSSQLSHMIPASSVLTALFFLPTHTRTFWTSFFQNSIYFLSFQLTKSCHATRVQWTVWGTQQYNQHNLSVSYIASPTSLSELISISITERLHPLWCQYDFILFLSANTIHKTKLNINHTVCSEVWTYYKHKSTGLHKSITNTRVQSYTKVLPFFICINFEV